MPYTFVHDNLRIAGVIFIFDISLMVQVQFPVIFLQQVVFDPTDIPESKLKPESHPVTQGS